MSDMLAGQSIIVTGAATGVGRAIALRLATEGARVHVCDINAAALAALQKERPEIGTTLANVADPAAVKRLFDDAVSRFGGLTGLVNNCGIAGPVGRVETLALEQWNAAIAINLTGSFLCMQHAIPLMRAAGGGSIVNISSVAGRIGFAFRASYCSTKWGVVGLAKAVAQEAGTENIRVNAVLPGAVESERVTQVLTARSRLENRPFADLRRETEELAALKRLIDPDEVGTTVAFLMSPGARAITGQAISVCGGAIGS